MTTIYNPIIVKFGTRSNQGSKNYLLIEETVIIKTSLTTGISYNNGIQTVLEEYELEDYTESKDGILPFIEDCMSSDNAATNYYKYFRVVLANGTDVICSSYDELIDLIGRK